MEFYTKSPSNSSKTDVNEDTLEVNIRSGKKIKTCISQALNALKSSKDKVCIIGSGPTVTKAITTAEIVKRKIKGLHQQNNLFYIKNEDVWEPKEEGLDQLKVTRNVPSISIVLSFKPLDKHTPGYQAPGMHQPLVQFRDEDIDLADERYEGTQDLKQAPIKQTDKRKSGTKRGRTQHGTEDKRKKDQSTKNEPMQRTPKRDIKKKNKGPKPSKRQHSDKNSEME